MTTTVPRAAERTGSVQVRDVRRNFGRGKKLVEALGPVDLDVRAGEFVSIVGPSGCGKSTLLRAIGGLIRPTSGRIELDVEGDHPLAMIFQDYGIYPWKRVQDNVRFGLDIQGVPRREGDVRARDWLDRLGLGDFAGAWPHELSGGMRQRVSIARAMTADPEILLMDEPFAALDAQLRALLQEELLQISQRDPRTVLFVTHSLAEAILLADRVVVMSARPGRILLDRKVPFGRPRTADIRRSPEFAELEDELWQTLRAEVTEQLGAQRTEKEGATDGSH